ncbi:N-formylglutamate deformylase [Yangia mangrovi]|uniref:N-formylglutamate deformylase n=1 Tax=Alloyangia mangrovi TaxID=1779329 RepID=A0A2A3JU55_9RHOB|nr:N-formylglutamate deformylase [Alloyangia mangrovi]MCT4371232.1 N-formylglutamate deformylase [Alloyangia mangrovi]
MRNEPVTVTRGDSPIVLGLPHTGTYLPDEIFDNLTPRGKELSDTDWHIHRLYEGLLPGATMVRATFHRYVIDANRPPDGASLYPGQNTTGLVPLTDFDGTPIWLEQPDEAEIAARRDAFHAPYHAALMAEMERVRAKHGVAILYDCHSIRSHIPFLFEGKLPAFNIGTGKGTTCDPSIEAATAEVCAAAEGYTSVLNGRFTGGWTTRHYGRPEEGFHAIQMELAQDTHLESELAPYAYDEGKAAKLRAHLAELLQRIEALAPALAK